EGETGDAVQTGQTQADGTARTELSSAKLPAGEKLGEAQRMAAQYDYDGAILLLKSDAGYEKNTELQAAVSEYEKQKAACVPYPAEEVTHIFFHTLIHDAAKAFDG